MVRGWTVRSAAILEKYIDRAGMEALHAQMYVLGTLLKHGAMSRKSTFYPRLRRVSRLQAFGVTEPRAAQIRPELALLPGVRGSLPRFGTKI